VHVEGLSLSRGDFYESSNRWDAFLVDANRRVWIDRSPADAHGAYNGLSGFYALLINGKNNGGMKDRHPRSAVGISRSGRYLFLMAIDGRQPGYSESASTGETAEWLSKLGAYNAINLDGGGSTPLVIEGPDGLAVVLNRPRDPPPGLERRVANHLGVFAQRLVDSKTAGR
jgi:exopolysaccharide biosynthesis protein